MFLTGHYLQLHSVVPTVLAAPPPHLQAAQLGCSVVAREYMIKHCHNINVIIYNCDPQYYHHSQRLLIS